MKFDCAIWMSAFFMVGVCIAVCGTALAASPQLPCEFYGTVVIQGSPAPVGTVITAFVNGTAQGKITVTDAGKFGGIGTFDERLIVMAGENDFANGVPMITFRINEQSADQSVPYQPGASTQINLTVGSVPQTSALGTSAILSTGGNASPQTIMGAQVSTGIPTLAPSSGTSPEMNQNVSITSMVNGTQGN